MSLLVPWLVFPFVFGALCVGCGAVVARLARVHAGPELLLPLGYAGLVVLMSFAVWIPRGAALATPLAVGTATVGLALLVTRGRPALRREVAAAVAAATVVLFVYGLPTLASGDPVFTGYVTLDDAATWFALVDHVVEHGRDTTGLAPSSHEATVDTYLSAGYPVGGLLPLGAATALTGEDVAWLFQPYVAFLAALLALSLFGLARPLVESLRARAFVAAVAAQPALLFGYAQWTGVKELAAAALIPLCCVLGATRGRSGMRGALPVATAAGALLAVLGVVGVVWLAIPLVILVVGGSSRRRVLPVLALTAILTLPTLAVSRRFAQSSDNVLRSEDELGNLIRPLDKLQVAGIWPSSDFRLEPDTLPPVVVLIGVACSLAVVGLVAAWRRAPGALVYVSTALVGAATTVAVGSPWVDGKALATASPAVIFAALVGCTRLVSGGRGVEGVIATAAVAGGVLWSNVLTYTGVSLAPYDQLVELERVGERFAGQGPTLMTEYQPYGVRHFLRRLDPEGASELRRRTIARTDGALVEKGAAVDLDELSLEAILVYRTMVLRRSPSASRPPSPYALVWQGAWYEVWQRPEPAILPVARLALGDGLHPAGRPTCAEIRALAAQGQTVAAVERPDAPLVLELPETGRQASFDVSGGGRHAVWLAGSTRVRVEVLVDGQSAGVVRQHVSHVGQYVRVGTFALEAGSHVLEVRLDRERLRPGSGATVVATTGPVVLAPASEPRAVTRYARATAGAACGRVLDWVEALP